MSKRRKKLARAEASYTSSSGFRYTALSSATMQRKERIAKTGIVNVMRMILEDGGLLSALSFERLLAPEEGGTHCFCSEGTEKCVACMMIKKNDRRQANPIIAPAIIKERCWKVMLPVMGTIAVEDQLVSPSSLLWDCGLERRLTRSRFIWHRTGAIDMRVMVTE